MNSVALPASASSPALSAESDLIRQAARGHSEAFEELYRRHSQPAWRLAQAVAMDRDSAIEAVREGFAKALRGHRRSRAVEPGDGVFRPQLLAAVYRSAAERGHAELAAAPKPRASSKHKDADAAFAEAAFRSLPERWRAAIWLSEVESMDIARIAAVLGVSSAVATQLIHRGKRGLAGRYSQARQAVPEHVGPALRSFALAVPANLADATEARWTAAGSDRESIFAPMTGWLEDRAIRPMWVSVGGLIALGLIGIGVLGPANALRSNLGANGAHNPTGAIPIHTCYGIPCASGSLQNPALNFTVGNGGTASGSAVGAAGGTAATTGGGAGSTAGGTTAPSTPAGSGSGTPTTPSTPGTTVPPPPTVTPITVPTVPQTTLTVPGVATVTPTSSGGTTVGLLPDSSGTPTASVTLDPNCTTPIGLTIGSTSVGCTSGTSTSSSGSSTTTSTTTPLSTVTSTVTNTVTGITSNL